MSTSPPSSNSASPPLSSHPSDLSHPSHPKKPVLPTKTSLSHTALLLFFFILPVAAQEAGNIRVHSTTGSTSQAIVSSLPIDLAAGMFLQHDTAILTSPDSSTTLLFDNGAILEIGPDSDIFIDSYSRAPLDPAKIDYKRLLTEPGVSNTRATLASGSIKIDVRKLHKASRFSITLPGGTLFLDGATCLLRFGTAPLDKPEICVAHGSARFVSNQNKTTPIPAGNCFTVDANPKNPTVSPSGPDSRYTLASTRNFSAPLRNAIPKNPFKNAHPTEPIFAGSIDETLSDSILDSILGSTSDPFAKPAPGNSKKYDEMVFVSGGRLPEGSKWKGTRVHPFLIARYETVASLWISVCQWAQANGYSRIRGTRLWFVSSAPIDFMLWCNARSEMEGLTPVYRLDGKILRKTSNPVADVHRVVLDPTANGYRIPTPTEWEWAARGGVKSRGHLFSGSDNLNEVGWWWENCGLRDVENAEYLRSIAIKRRPLGEKPDPNEPEGWGPNSPEPWKSRLMGWNKDVGLKRPNELGIHDMSGRMHECSHDPETNTYFVHGGAMLSEMMTCSVAWHSPFEAERSISTLRPVRSLIRPKTP